MNTRWIAIAVEQEVHATYAEEARRQNDKQICKVSLAEVVRKELTRGANRLRAKHQIADTHSPSTGDN